MLATILQDFAEEVKSQVAQLQRELHTTFDFTAVEQALAEMVNELMTTVLQQLITELLSARQTLQRLKVLGSRLALRFKEYRTVHLRLSNGQMFPVRSPYFIKAPPQDKRRRKKRGPNGSGAHLGLEALGFIGRCSSQLVSEVVKMAVLAPSFAVAQAMLAGRGLAMDVKTIRRLCRALGALGLAGRGALSVGENEDLTGYTLVVGIDGGRLRERRKKPGRKKKGSTRQGYYTDWKEPKLFTLYLLDAQGASVKEFAPWHDATGGNDQALFALLTQYLQALDLTTVQRIVFCGDGARWIWRGVETLCQTLGLTTLPVYQVLDYTHAQQNLHELLEWVPEELRQGTKLERQWKQLLWAGNSHGLRQEICRWVPASHQAPALKKWRDYFERNRKRMQYATFKAAHLPCGSGCVESAIRRVINLRLKAAGSFWTPEMAEYFLFLRSQLVSGRWQTFFRNVIRRPTRTLNAA